MFFDVWLAGQSLWNTPLLAVLFGLNCLYLFFMKQSLKIKIYHKQPLLFICGLILFYFMIGSPFASISHLSFSLHMFQMSLLFFITPPLLLLGIPAQLWQPVWNLSILKKIPPCTSLYTFAVLFLMYHVPAILTFLSQNPYYHQSYFLILMLLAFGMWFPITATGKFTKTEKNRYAYLSGMVLMPACLLFIISALLGGMNNPFLSEITANLCMGSAAMHSGLILPFPFNTKWDQLLAGILMLLIHKIGLLLTSRYGDNVQIRNLEKNA
ncbi:cytochrome c oxidase assembly protein [Bacillus sp. BRMEA1]|uniref:cytochrome c oxidase assembly protein n=1 Tax=Neobacillus endophyticus TaxID=2738405 RepID=UPI0015676BD1|nr:cytochrome c oxidase assembly protein [Neobacillus endophyticus]NRD76525.1 cytochrome c oxidase assembly protein [Neobacillus endophyticus]